MEVLWSLLFNRVNKVDYNIFFSCYFLDLSNAFYSKNIWVHVFNHAISSPYTLFNCHDRGFLQQIIKFQLPQKHLYLIAFIIGTPNYNNIMPFLSILLSSFSVKEFLIKSNFQSHILLKYTYKKALHAQRAFRSSS